MVKTLHCQNKLHSMMKTLHCQNRIIFLTETKPKQTTKTGQGSCFVATIYSLSCANIYIVPEAAIRRHCPSCDQLSVVCVCCVCVCVCTNLPVIDTSSVKGPVKPAKIYITLVHLKEFFFPLDPLGHG